MPFNPTTEDLWLEIKAAMDETDQHVEHSAAIVRNLTGRWYRQDSAGDTEQPENFGFSFMSNMLPTLGVNNPKVKVNAARVVGHQIIAQAMTDGLNAWVKDIGFLERIEPVLVDFMVSRGVLLHRLDEDSRFSRGSVTPSAKRISPRRFFQDSQADTADEDEFRGHWSMIDVEDLLADEQVLPDVKEKLVAQSEDPQEVGGQDGAPFDKASASGLGRKRVKLYSVWLRELNQIRVLCELSETMEVYPARPYYGPPTGPYELFDAYPVPDQPWPLSPLVAVQDQALDLNIHARSMGRAAARRRTIGLVEAANPDMLDTLTNAEDGAIVPVKGITGNHVVIEIGGVTQEQYAYVEVARERLDRISGLTATVQGAVGAADTATEAKIANDALSGRVGYLKKRVTRACNGSLMKAGWYLFHTEGIVIPVNRRDMYTGEQIEGLFFGGPLPSDMGATWDDFDLEIEFNTLQKEATARDDMLAFYSIFQGVAQAAPMMPWVRWMNVLRDIEAVFNLVGKSDEWMIPELFGAFSMPEQFPPSAVMGQPGTPPRGGAPLANQPRAGLMQQPNPGFEPMGRGQPGSGAGQINSAGQTGGPRPGGGGGGGMSFAA